MNYEEREKEFLKELTKLAHKYRITIGGCGFWGSPSLVDKGDMVQVYLPKQIPAFQDFPIEQVEYSYGAQLEFNKVKTDANHP